MNTQLLGTLLAAIILIHTVSVKAHEHAGAGERPDCAAMQESGSAGMDMNDPIAQAMMKKCMSTKHQQGTTDEGNLTEKSDAGELLPDTGRSHNHDGE